MKLALRIIAFFVALGIVAALTLPLIEARRAVPKEDRRAGVVSLNYYANLRFLLGRVGLGDALIPLQSPAYRTVSDYDDIAGAKAYADYLFYILPADGQKLDTRLAETREVQEKAQGLLAVYAAQTPERAFIRDRQFEQVARSVKVLAAFKGEADAAQVEGAWLAAKDVQHQPLPEGLAAAYYWHVMDDAAKAVLKLAEREQLCIHPFTFVYQEIRAAFRANGNRIAQLLVREGKLKAADVKPNAAVRSKVADQADSFIEADCSFMNGSLQGRARPIKGSSN